MFATIGYILPEYWRFPGYLSKFLDIKFAEVPNGLSAFSKEIPGRPGRTRVFVGLYIYIYIYIVEGALFVNKICKCMMFKIAAKLIYT